MQQTCTAAVGTVCKCGDRGKQHTLYLVAHVHQGVVKLHTHAATVEPDIGGTGIWRQLREVAGCHARMVSVVAPELDKVLQVGLCEGD